MWTPTLIDQVEIFWREGIVAGNLTIGQVRRDLGQCIALLGSQIRRNFLIRHSERISLVWN